MTTLEQCFDAFAESAFRLETLRAYAGQADEPRFVAYREFRPLPERSVRTSPWLRNMAVTTAAGKHWQRVRVLSADLSAYEEFELLAYAESAVVGEDIRIAVRSPATATLGGDFWLFDAGTPAAVAALMVYDDGGRYTGSEVTSDPIAIAECVSLRDRALQFATPLNAYLAERRRQVSQA